MKKIWKKFINIFVDVPTLDNKIKSSLIKRIIVKAGYIKLKKSGSNFVILELKSDRTIDMQPLFQASKEEIKSILKIVIKNLK